MFSPSSPDIVTIPHSSTQESRKYAGRYAGQAELIDGVFGGGIPGLKRAAQTLGYTLGSMHQIRIGARPLMPSALALMRSYLENRTRCRNDEIARAVDLATRAAKRDLERAAEAMTLITARHEAYKRERRYKLKQRALNKVDRD